MEVNAVQKFSDLAKTPISLSTEGEVLAREFT